MDGFLGATATFLSKNPVKTWKAMQNGWFPGGYSMELRPESEKTHIKSILIAEGTISWGLQHGIETRIRENPHKIDFDC